MLGGPAVPDSAAGWRARAQGRDPSRSGCPLCLPTKRSPKRKTPAQPIPHNRVKQELRQLISRPGPLARKYHNAHCPGQVS
jgi:hypothetical protein